MAVHSDTELFALLDSARPVAFQTANQKPTKPKQGRGVRLEDPESWPEPVDGAALLDALAAVFERYLALPPHASTVLALWVLHTYNMDVAFTSPILAITSPVKQCGKTQLLIVLGAVVARRLFASNVTSAALFRTIEQYTPTLLIDEADTFLRDNEELRGVLNSGHTRTTASVIRTAGDDHEPRQFSTWCAKAIASIGRLPGHTRRIAERQAATEVVKKPYTIKRKDGTAIAVPEHRRPIAGAPNAEINRELTVLKRMFTLARRSGKLLYPPHVPMLEERNTRTGFFELEMLHDVLALLPEALQSVIEFAYITGWRIPSEVLTLEWRQVGFKAGEVRLDPETTKNREGRVFPMTDDLRALLDSVTPNTSVSS